ncbi:hypothetical protein DPMN_145390 [Dreissena polymorpha]|uniref:Uncharacterized protein n=1 Tax=Dreissena polymorpha TaxID=45954 RepID=A0A9D4J102_DREPO|nr:hypothetical protein DPMN_145390 [Dreissena polymorpha]
MMQPYQIHHSKCRTDYLKIPSSRQKQDCGIICQTTLFRLPALKLSMKGRYKNKP